MYREWAPAARVVQLIGDFNDWTGWNLERESFGTWKISIPKGADDERGPISHGSRVKVRIQTPQGNWVDRIPAWITYATVDANSFGAAYDGVYWSPPRSERHKWLHKRPKVPGAEIASLASNDRALCDEPALLKMNPQLFKQIHDIN